MNLLYGYDVVEWKKVEKAVQAKRVTKEDSGRDEL